MVSWFNDFRRVTIADSGEGQPRWSRNGRQLFYITGDDKKLMAVDFDPVTATARAPRVVVRTRIIGAARIGFQYDVAPDGRFIVNALTNAASLTLMSGWTSRLNDVAARSRTAPNRRSARVTS